MRVFLTAVGLWRLLQITVLALVIGWPLVVLHGPVAAVVEFFWVLVVILAGLLYLGNKGSRRKPRDRGAGA